MTENNKKELVGYILISVTYCKHVDILFSNILSTDVANINLM